MQINPQLIEKIKESLFSVLPITAIVLLLSVTIAPLAPGVIVLFSFGAFLYQRIAHSSRYIQSVPVAMVCSVGTLHSILLQWYVMFFR